MKKRILSLIMVFTMLTAAVVPFISCSSKNSDGAKVDSVTRLTVDINPSIEFMVDENSKIVSATALNDDGSILIAGEVFVGKTPEEAVELTISLAAETGYLVKGNVTADANTVKISVSGDSQVAKDFAASIENKTKAVLEKLDIKGKVEKVAALNKEALVKLASTTSLYTEEELNAMDEVQLYKAIAAGRIETALLLTEDMREAYYAAKEHRISFAHSEETQKVIDTLGAAQQTLLAGYKMAVDTYAKSIEALDNFRYNSLVSPDSAYQKSLAKLRESKTEFLKNRTYVASLDVNGETYAQASITLKASEEDYNKAVAAYEKLGEDVNASLVKLIEAMRSSEAKLRELEKTIFPDDLKTKLTENAEQMEKNINDAKDRFFTEFEAEHKDDIAAMEQALKNQKQKLMDSIDNK